MRAASGADRPRRSAASLSRRVPSARDCSCRPRLSAASSWICCCSGALLVAAGLRRAQGLLEAGQLTSLIFGLRRQCGRLFVGRNDLPADRFDLLLGLAAALLPHRVLRREFGHALLDARTAVHHVADALLEAAGLEGRFGQQPLGAVQRVARLVMRLTHGVEFALDLAQLRELVVERQLRGDHRLPGALLLLGRVAMLEEPQLVLLECTVVL
jgi:hypothetical protein